VLIAFSMRKYVRIREKGEKKTTPGIEDVNLSPETLRHDGNLWRTGRLVQTKIVTGLLSSPVREEG